MRFNVTHKKLVETERVASEHACHTLHIERIVRDNGREGIDMTLYHITVERLYAYMILYNMKLSDSVMPRARMENFDLKIVSWD